MTAAQVCLVGARCNVNDFLIRTMGCIYRKGRALARGPLQPWMRRSPWLLLSQDYCSTVLICPLQFSTPWGVAISLSASAGHLNAFCCCQVCRPLELFDFIFCPSESWWLSWSPCVLFVWGIIHSGCGMWFVQCETITEEKVRVAHQPPGFGMHSYHSDVPLVPVCSSVIIPTLT